jgi:hypothetical protein
MSGETSIERCQATSDCAGAQLEGIHCLEHLTAQELEVVVARLRAGGPLDARNTTISAERLEELLHGLRHEERSVLPATDFDGATFSGSASFSGATFSGSASFNGATFSDDASFDGATFSGNARFDKATFSGSADFDGATFSGNASFNRATFSGSADFDGTSFSGSADFDRASLHGSASLVRAAFSGNAIFNRATFSGNAIFMRATFSGDARFRSATFSGDARFRSATFSGYARFSAATCRGSADFDGATFSGVARFDKATFSGSADFDGATFSGSADFNGASLHGSASLVGATFSGNAVFDGATFSGIVSFANLLFERDASFVGASFERARELAQFVVGCRVVLDDCVFLERVRLEVAARVVSARATTFAAGALLRVRWAEIALDDADFARPSTLSTATIWRADSDLPAVCLLDDRHIELELRPRLVTLRGAHVAALSLSNVDLRACRFFGAHGLESLSIEASCRWPHAPRERLLIDRETIAEEHAWRGWSDPVVREPAWLGDRDGSELLASGQVAALYRALRKAREDHKDQAGAGDLYYGEMEMRRHSKQNGSAGEIPRGRGDAAILWVYWLLSGYGLRPARALLALAITLLVGAAVLSWCGFHDPLGHPRGYGRSLLFATESALSVLRPPEISLSAGGEIIQISLRLLGPLLFGLALLAVRARVKR